MKTLSAALLTMLDSSVTRPGHLVELCFLSVLNLSTMGATRWTPACGVVTISTAAYPKETQ
jgi:hypothetical protein